MAKHKRQPTDRLIVLVKCCGICRTFRYVQVYEREYSTWLAGTPIDLAMPRLPREDRITLTSGLCRECFDKLHGTAPQKGS